MHHCRLHSPRPSHINDRGLRHNDGILLAALLKHPDSIVQQGDMLE